MFTGVTGRGLVFVGARDMRVLWATVVASVLHLVGLAGMLWIDRSWFTALTPLNLLLMTVALVWTQTHRNLGFLLFMAVAFVSGMAAESVGVNTGRLFGDYVYGTVLGPQILGVPLIIGFNWFMVVFAAASATGLLMERLESRLETLGMEWVRMGLVRSLSHALLTALAATVFDWVMEPVAVKLGFWAWTEGAGIPLLNYVCWFALAFLLASVARLFRVDTRNLFAANLFLVQLMFFTVLRFLL